MKKLVFEVKIAIRGPYIFAGLTAANFGVDTSALRDEDRPAGEDGPGPALIPGDHVRGHLRAGFEMLGGDVKRWFGKHSDKKGDNDSDINMPEPGNLQFSDLTASEAQSSLAYTRVSIDDSTGAAKAGALQVIELAAPLNAVSVFTGKIVAFAKPDGKDALLKQLNQALKLTVAMGGVKSAGFGEVVHEQSSIGFVEALDCFPGRAGAAGADRVAFDVTFDRPVLTNGEWLAGNVLRGGRIIPGGVIKGTLARAIAMAGVMDDGMGKALAAMVFSHCFLVDGKDRSLPLSVVKQADTGRLGDVLKEHCRKDDGAGKHESKAPLIGGQAPVFQMDWKSDGIPEPGIARGHTQIGDQGTAEDEHMFVTIAQPVRGRTWRFVIDRNGADQRAFGQVVAALEAGLHGVGHTHAAAQFERLKGETDIRCDGPLEVDGRDCWPVMLETPAVMTNPQNTASAADQYEACFRCAIGKPVELLCHYASRRPAGGYQAMRFKPFGKGVFQPFELTEAGSVFLLAGVKREDIEQLCRRGVAAFMPGLSKPLTWRNCPFVAENGYGEVSVNSARHELLAKEVAYA